MPEPTITQRVGALRVFPEPTGGQRIVCAQAPASPNTRRVASATAELDSAKR